MSVAGRNEPIVNGQGWIQKLSVWGIIGFEDVAPLGPVQSPGGKFGVKPSKAEYFCFSSYLTVNFACDFAYHRSICTKSRSAILADAKGVAPSSSPGSATVNICIKLVFVTNWLNSDELRFN